MCNKKNCKLINCYYPNGHYMRLAYSYSYLRAGARVRSWPAQKGSSCGETRQRCCHGVVTRSFAVRPSSRGEGQLSTARSGPNVAGYPSTTLQLQFFSWPSYPLPSALYWTSCRYFPAPSCSLWPFSSRLILTLTLPQFWTIWTVVSVLSMSQFHFSSCSRLAVWTVFSQSYLNPT